MRQKCSAVIIGVGPEQGLGASLACYFAAKGLHVFIAGRSEDKLQFIAEKIRQNAGSATPVVADATVEHEVANLFNKIQSDGYSVDIAAYNVDCLCLCESRIKGIGTRHGKRVWSSRHTCGACHYRRRD
jgi:short-subunit dehydrogenase